MESSHWSELNKDIEIVATTKSFYQKFLYRATFRISGVYILKTSFFKLIGNDSRADEFLVGDIVSRIRAIVNEPYYARSSVAYTGELYQARANTLLFVYRVVQTISRNADFRVRMEGASLNIYCTDEDKLLEFIAESKIEKWLTTVSRPESDEIKELLTDKVIIVTVPQEYGHKVLLREGKYPLPMRLAIRNYLVSLDAEVRMTNATSGYLQQTQDYMPGCYFYTKDKRTVDFVRLIAPNIVVDIYELRYLPAK